MSAIVPGLAVAGSFGFAAKPIDAPKPIKKYGLLTANGHRAHKAMTGETLHVYVDGVDVTSSCFEVDDVEGYALIFCRDEQEHRRWDAKGAKHIDKGHGGRACQMRLTGNVVVAPGADL